MKIFDVYKENARLKKENKELKEKVQDISYGYSKSLERENLFKGRIDNLLDKQFDLQQEITELSEKNYELAKKLKNIIK